MIPINKYYLRKNARFNDEIRPYKPTSQEEYELILSSMSHPIIKWNSIEEYNEEMKERHYQSEEDIIKSEIELAHVQVGSEERLKELEENGPEDELFIKWVGQ